MIGMYERRGGTPEEFVNALYHVHRQLKGADGNQSPCSSKQSRSSTGSSGRGSLASKGPKFSGEDSDTSGKYCLYSIIGTRIVSHFCQCP